jgi:hypothetical protein
MEVDKEDIKKLYNFANEMNNSIDSSILDTQILINVLQYTLSYTVPFRIDQEIKYLIEKKRLLRYKKKELSEFLKKIKAKYELEK